MERNLKKGIDFVVIQVTVFAYKFYHCDRLFTEKIFGAALIVLKKGQVNVCGKPHYRILGTIKN